MFRQCQHLRLDTITKPQQATVWCHFILKTQSGNGACLDSVSIWDLITSHRKLWLGTSAFWKQSLTPDSVTAWDLMPNHTKLWLGTSAFWKQSLTPDTVTAWDLMPNHTKLWPGDTAFCTMITKHSRSTPVATAFWTVYSQVLNHDYQTSMLCLLHSIFKLFSVKPSTMITRDNSPVNEEEDGHQEVNKGTRQLTCWWGGRHQEVNKGTRQLTCWWGGRWTPGGRQRDKPTHFMMRGKTPGGKQRDKPTHLLMRGKMDTRR